MEGGSVVATSDQEWSRRIDLHMQSARELRIAACYHRAFKRLTSREPMHRNAWDAEHIEYSCGGPDVRPPGAWQ